MWKFNTLIPYTEPMKRYPNSNLISVCILDLILTCIYLSRIAYCLLFHLIKFKGHVIQIEVDYVQDFELIYLCCVPKIVSEFDQEIPQ